MSGRADSRTQHRDRTLSLLAMLRLRSTLKMVLPRVIKNVACQVGRLLRGRRVTAILFLPSAASGIPGSYVSHTSLHARRGLLQRGPVKSDARITSRD